MAEPIGALRADLQANIGEFVANMRKAREVAQTQADGMSKAMNKTKSSFDGVGASFKKMVGAIGGMYLAKQIIAMADGYTLLDNKLKLVTGSTEELRAAQEGLYQQSLRSYSSYESSVDLFSRFARATQTLGVSQQELIRITESINKAFIISGATQTESYNATIQLSQGMASGVLRGEEFNSIMEQGSRIAQMLAEYLQTDVGGLRAMAKDGKITSDIMIKAFSASAEKIDKEFAKMQPTIGQAMTNLKTVFGRLLSDSNKSAEGTKSVADEILKLADTIEQNKPGIIDLFTMMISLAGKTVKALGNIGQSFRGWAAVKRGELSLGDFAGMNPEELKEWLDKYDTAYGRLDAKLQKIRQKEANALFPWNKEKYAKEAADIEAQMSGLSSSWGEPVPKIEPKKGKPKVDPKAVEEAEKRYKKGQEAILQLERERTLIGETSKLEAMRFDTSKGQYKDLTKEQKTKLLALAEEVDALDELQKMKERSEKIDEEAVKKRDSLMQEIAAIEEQALAVNMTSREMAIYKLQSDGASESQIEFADAMLRAVERADELKKILEEIKTPQDEYNEKVAKLKTLLDEGVLTWDQYTAAMQKAKDFLDDANKKEKDDLKDLKQMIQGWGKESADAIAEFAMGGKASFSDMINSMIKDLLKMMLYQKLIGPLFNGISSVIGGGTFMGGWSSFGTGKAFGGSVSPGKMYEVNERGVPELLNVGNRQFLMMGSQGGAVTALDSVRTGNNSISPDSRSGQSGQTTVIYNITAMDAKSMEEVFIRNGATIETIIDKSMKSNSKLRSTMKRTR